jgi:hypothetical protein
MTLALSGVAQLCIADPNRQAPTSLHDANVPSRRQFEPITLADSNLDERVAGFFMALRSDKRSRALAISATRRLRHLIDVAALESILDRAARYELSDEGSNASEYLDALILALDVELSETLEERRVLTNRIVNRTTQNAMARVRRSAR